MPEQGHVPVEEVQPALSGVLPRSGGDDTEVGVGGGGVVDRGVDLHTGEEGGGVLEVQHLTAELVFLGVDEGELVGEVLSDDCLGDGHPHVPHAHHRYLRVALRQRRWSAAADCREECF